MSQEIPDDAPSISKKQTDAGDKETKASSRRKRLEVLEDVVCSEDEAEDIDIAPTPSELSQRDIKFKAVVVEKGLSYGFADSKTKMSKEALVMMEFGLRVFVLETLCRCAQQAQNDGQVTVEPSHLEKVIPQLMLDF